MCRHSLACVNERRAGDVVLLRKGREWWSTYLALLSPLTQAYRPPPTRSHSDIHTSPLLLDMADKWTDFKHMLIRI